VPDGAVATKRIGPAGGIITSADNRVVLVIPAGALSAETEISVQPITNEAPHGLGQAYRFSPDGTKFAKPATLKFSYDPRTVAANDPDAFKIATQGTDRRWHYVSGVAVDTNAHTISAPMPHFSDWTAYELFKIENISLEGANFVELGGSVDIELLFASLLEPIQVPVEGNVEISDVKFSVAGGAVNGSVKATGAGSQEGLESYPARYTAPTKNPPSNPVTVVADVTLKGSKAKIQVVKQILIGEDYYRVNFAGSAFNWDNMHFVRDGSDLIISGYNESPDQSMHIIINDADVRSPNRKYPYAERADENAWGEFSRDYTGSEGGWLSAHNDCPKGVRVSPGGVTITQISIVNGVEYVQGHFTGTYYNRTEGCPTPLRSAPIEGEFRVRNAYGNGRKPAGVAKFKGHTHP